MTATKDTTPKTLSDLDTYEEDFFEQEYGEDAQEEDERAGAAFPGFAWYNKRPDADTGEENRTGWHAKRGVHPDFDEAMDKVVESGEAEVVRIMHNDEDGDTVQEYYHLTRGARVFILSRGTQSPWKMNKKPEENVGIAYGWPVDRKLDKGVATLKFQAILLPLFKAGYAQPVTFGCKRSWVYSRHNATIFDVLTAHQRVVDAANALLKSRGKEPTIKFRHIALDLLQAAKPEWRGKPGTNEKKLCFAIVTNIPKAPAPIEDKFILSRYCGGELRKLIDDSLNAAIEWSKTVGVIWRDGSLEDNANSDNGARRKEREEDFDPFAGDDIDPGDFGEEEPLMSTAPQRASNDARRNLREFAGRYEEYGVKDKAALMRALANRADLTDGEAARAIQEASRETFELKKAKEATKTPQAAASGKS